MLPLKELIQTEEFWIETLDSAFWRVLKKKSTKKKEINYIVDKLKKSGFIIEKKANAEIYEVGKSYPVKTIPASHCDKYGLDKFPNFSNKGSITGMKQKYYGKDALLIRCGNYIYNVTSEPNLYFDITH